MRFIPICQLSALLVLPACGTDSDGAVGEGTVTVTAYGESFIEDGIPAAAVGDGWAVRFSRFVVSVRDVTVAGEAIKVPATIDLSAPSSGKGHKLGSAPVPAGEHQGASFTIARVEVEGNATKDSTKTFSWIFEEPTRYEECETTTTVTADGNASFQITMHADHLLYDSLIASEPRVLFQSLADADRDGDGAITEAELAAKDIGGYDPGSEDGVDDLKAWLVAQSRTLAHVNGEGHCHAVAAN